MALEDRVYRRLLTGWKSPAQLARELGVPEREVVAAIRRLCAEGKLFRDGPLYIAKAGVALAWGED